MHTNAGSYAANSILLEADLSTNRRGPGDVPQLGALG